MRNENRNSLNFPEFGVPLQFPVEYVWKGISHVTGFFAYLFGFERINHGRFA